MRMRVLSSAYGRLKTKLPNIPPDTKLSKLDTLRLATLYIKQLINAVETGNGGGSPHAFETLADPRNRTPQLTACASSSAGDASFSFHNGGHVNMSWPFEFHQQHAQNRHPNPTYSSSSGSSRMDWQNTPSSSYTKPERSEHSPPDASYTQLQQTDCHWYQAEMAMQLESTRNLNGCCAYDATGLGQQQQQQQRGISITTSQTHL
ncbi:uncharacterized protein LOC108595456 isoform X2 [Drosophila busckii]|nr:uncharacterized protein LOC108595456 isoform X2 [Drosophila busckii]